MATIQDIEKAFQTKQGLSLDKDYRGSKQVGFVGDKATIGGKTFSTPQELYSAVYGGSPAGIGSNYAQPNFQSTLERAIELQRQAAQPAIQSLQASIPEIQQSYATQRESLESQKDPLAARYDALIADITRRQGVAETGAIKTTSRELGRRGIVGSSGVADVAMQEAVQPIQSEYASLATQAGLEKEAGLQSLQQQITNLTPLEVEAIRDVNNAIAQLQSATTSEGISNALSQLQLAQEQAKQAEQQRQFNVSSDWAKRIYEETTLPESIAKVANAGSDSGFSIDDFLSLFGLGGTIETETTGFTNVDNLIAQGKYDEARKLLLNP